MASITYWNRLIPTPLETSFDSGLSAQVRDPAWTLARQLQMGEFLGGDGGSPAYADIGVRLEFLHFSGISSADQGLIGDLETEWSE
jgi:hypothetical protein